MEGKTGMEKFIIGVLIGGMAGALAVSNNAKMRMLVKKGEDDLKEKVNGMIDEKLSVMLEKCGKSQESEGENAQDKETKKNKKKSDKKQQPAGGATAQTV